MGGIVVPSSGAFDATKFREVTWYKDPGLRKLYALCAVIIMSSATTGFDGSMMNGLQMVDHWQDYFNHPKGGLLGLFNAIMGIGSIVGLPFAPYISDKFGRRIAIMCGIFFMMIGIALQTAANSFSMFIAARFFIGFGCSIAQASAPLLLTELCHPQHRGVVTAIYNTTWHVGAIIATWTTFGTFEIDSDWSWRAPSLMQALPSVVQLTALWLVPESPRWLVSKDRPEAALKVLATYHANGDENDALVQFQYTEIRGAIEMEKSLASRGWQELWATKGNRHRLFLLATAGLFSQWSGNGLVSYYFNLVLDDVGITSSDTQFKINGALSIYNWAVALGMAFTVDKFGRRPLFLASTAGMLISFTIWTICSAQYNMNGNDAAAKGVIAMIFIYSTTYNFAWSGLLVAYSVEILPFYIRAKGLMLMNLFVQIALVFNQYVNPIGLDKLEWKYYIFYCVWIAVELIVVYFFYIETKGPTLEDIAKLFDGDDAPIVDVILQDGKVIVKDGHHTPELADEKHAAVHSERV
jgi:sugar porter (SP) family MFS transporter